MKLTKDQINQLKSLTEHPGFKIIELIEEYALNELGQKLTKADLSDERQIKVLKENQLYVKARKDFLENIKKHTLDIYTNEIKLF